MANKKYTLQFDAKLELKDVLSKVETFRNQLNSVELPEGATKKFEKAFEKVLNSIESFDVLADRGVESLTDTKALEKAWKGVLRDLDNLSVVFRGLDASNVFPKSVTDNIKSAENALAAYNKKLEGARGSDAYKAKLEERVQAANKQAVFEKQLADTLQKQYKAEGVHQAKQAEWTTAKQQEYAQQQQKIKNAEAELKKYNRDLEKASNTVKKLQKEGYITSDGKVGTKKRQEVEKMADSPEKKKAEKKLAEAEGAVTKFNQLKNAKADYTGMVAGAKEAAAANEKLKAEVDEAAANYQKLTNEVTSYTQQADQAKANVDRLGAELDSMATKEAEQEWKALVAAVKAFTGVDLDESVQDVEAIKQALAAYQAGEIEKLPQIFEQIKQSLDETAPAAKKVTDAVEETGEAAKEVARAETEIENLKNQIKDFFSITNSIQLFKRAISSAMDTVKELDATMTEAAVVTDFSIGDMWDKLPEYSTEAQKLGVSINGMYQATTLYYQQGLKNRAAMELGIETMKMAKIAGMDTSEATQAMTAALRGFNMELNQTSATRVNDVYSQLAAVTAADTNQIATAMEKTASIAASANMEFETTAAFLSQIIETTQEAPETAGTALKTIIARFAEVKSLRDQGLTSGEDEEGEIIDVNKIQAALRTVGISMEGFFAGTEGLDDILLKLSEKWDDLDFETQRYIATMAAGSRQQSRFIAMMSDYGRTTELVSEAQNSAGASQKQFEKTQKSLATSLQKLKNAWDQFTMGLANNEVLKLGVDLLTGVLETVNKLTDAISGGDGLVKSLTSLIGVVGALKLGKTVFDSAGFSNLLGGLTGQQGSWTETRTDAKGNVVEEHVVKNPVKQGQQTGNKAGTGFVAGFKRAVETKSKNPLQWMKGFALNEQQVFDPKKFAGWLNQAPEAGSALDKIKKQFQAGEITAEQAAKKVQELDVSLEEVGATSKITSVNLAGIGQAAMGTGAALGLLSQAFESWGMEEAAEDVSQLASVFMAAGAAVSALGPIVNTVSKILVTAGIEVQAAWWWAAAIVVALGAIVGLVVAWNNYSNKNSMATKIEEAEKATQEAKTAAEEAKAEYDSLLSKNKDYDSLQEKLNELTKGTKEWRQALLETNQQVMDLLTTYPELAKYLTRGEHGQLIIDDAGWDELIAKQEEKMRNTQTWVQTQSAEESKLKKQNVLDNASTKYFDDIERNKTFTEEQLKIIAAAYETNNEIWTDDAAMKALAQKVGVENVGAIDDAIEEYISAKTDVTYQKGYASKGELAPQEEVISFMMEKGLNTVSSDLTTKQNYEIIEALANKYLEDSSFFGNQEEMLKAANELGITVDSLKNLQEAAVETAAVLNEIEVRDQAGAEVVMQMHASETVADYEYGDAIIAAAAKDWVKNSESRITTTAGEIYQDDGTAEIYKENSEFLNVAKEYFGLGLESFTGNDYKDLQTLITAAGGDASKYADTKEGRAAMAKDIAEIVEARRASGEMDQVYGKMKGLDEQSQKLYAAALSGNTGNLSKAELEKLGSTDGEAIARTLGLTEEQKKTFLEGLGKLKSEIAEELGGISEITDKAKGRGITVNKTIEEKGRGKEIQSYVDLMTQAMTTGGKEALENGFNKIFSDVNISDGTKQKIVEAMDTFNWEEEGAGEAFLSFLKTLGIEIEGVTTEGSDFANEMKLVNAAFRDFDIDSILDQVKKGIEEAEEIAEQERLTNEQYKKYVASGMIDNADEWSWDGQGWVNVTDGMSSLVQALKANVEATYGLTQIEAQRQLDWYNSAKAAIEGTTTWTQGQTIVRSDGTSVYKKPTEIKDQAAINALKAGTAGEHLWKTIFNTKEEYDRWVELNKNGVSDLEALAGMDIDFNNIDLSGDQEDYDKYYNTYEKLAAIARKRERLEQERNDLLEDGNYKEALENRGDIRNQLQAEITSQANLASRKREEINALLADNAGLRSRTGLDISEDGAISFDQSVVNAMSQSDREDFDNLLSQLESLRDQEEEAKDNQAKAQRDLRQMQKEDRSDYIDFTSQIKDAIKSEQQKTIDELRTINDSINDANAKMLESMQQQIDEYRQNRDNEKSEQDIEDKQRRLAYLQQDTSGANAVEIMQLQKEIDEAQESYTDQLIDQKINELQQQNDEAAEQRERQIQLMEERNKMDEETGKIWEEVRRRMAESQVLDSNGDLNESSSLLQMMRKQAGYDSMSTEEKAVWDENFKVSYGRAMTHQANAYGVNGATTTFTTADNKTLSGTYNAQASTITVGSNVYSVSLNNGKFTSTENSKEENALTPAWNSEFPKPSSHNVTIKKDGRQTPEQTKGLQHALNLALNAGLAEDGNFGPATEAAVEQFQAKHGLRIDGTVGPSTKAVFRDIYQYKTGGLADFTGPAWLDGTKSRPEYVLNADQTKAFFSLVDVLEGLRHNDTARTAQNNGDMTFDIDINVESINDTADLEMISQYVEDKIVASANYRNNNMVSRLK